MLNRGAGKSDVLSVEGGRRGTPQQQEAHLRYLKTVRDMIAGHFQSALVQQHQEHDCDEEETCMVQ